MTIEKKNLPDIGPDLQLHVYKQSVCDPYDVKMETRLKARAIGSNLPATVLFKFVHLCHTALKFIQ